ncbi:hypothetical protein D3C74_381740 [compost metagenome]
MDFIYFAGHRRDASTSMAGIDINTGAGSDSTCRAPASDFGWMYEVNEATIILFHHIDSAIGDNPFNRGRGSALWLFPDAGRGHFAECVSFVYRHVGKFMVFTDDTIWANGRRTELGTRYR